MKFIILCIIAFLLSGVCCAQNLLGIEGENATLVGVYIKDINSGDVLYDYNSEIAMTPASVMKIVTSSSAMGVLGTDFRFKTEVELRGSESASGVWQGDLVVVASGDPTINSDFLARNVNIVDSIYIKLKKIGIRKINGRIRVEENMSQAGPNSRWEIEDVAWPYGAGLFDFNYRDNTTVVYPLTGVTRPKVPGLKIDLIKNRKSNDIVRGWGSDKLTVYAKSNVTKKWALQISVPNPAAVFIEALKMRLNDGGIIVSNAKSKVSTAKSATKVIYTHLSPTAIEILRSLMVRSDNLYAEAMLRAIAPGKSREDAIEQERKLWADRGLDSSCSIIFDGSGLTRANRLQPIFVADILEWMAQSQYADDFVGLFPKAGVDGTLENFLQRSPLKGKLALKTGSVNAVQCYAGYKLDDDNNPTHVVAVFVNGFFCRRAEVRKAVEQLMTDTFLVDKTVQ